MWGKRPWQEAMRMCQKGAHREGYTAFSQGCRRQTASWASRLFLSAKFLGLILDQGRGNGTQTNESGEK